MAGWGFEDLRPDTVLSCHPRTAPTTMTTKVTGPEGARVGQAPGACDPGSPPSLMWLVPTHGRVRKTGCYPTRGSAEQAKQVSGHRDASQTRQGSAASVSRSGGAGGPVLRSLVGKVLSQGPGVARRRQSPGSGVWGPPHWPDTPTKTTDLALSSNSTETEHRGAFGAVGDTSEFRVCA